jgi:hypothetical protein
MTDVLRSLWSGALSPRHRPKPRLQLRRDRGRRRRRSHDVTWAAFGSGWRDINDAKPVAGKYTPAGAQFIRIGLPERIEPSGETVSRMGAREISGLFASELLDALSPFGEAYRELSRSAEAAIERAEELKCWRDEVVDVDVRDGRVVGARMTSR